MSAGRLWLGAVIVLSTALLAWQIAFHKENFHVDELWTYAHANSTQGAYLSPRIDSYLKYVRTDLFYRWIPGEAFHDYLTVQPEEAFRYGHIGENLKVVEHPPLYFWLLHTICSFFPDVFSKWQSAGLNLAIWVALLAALFMFYALRQTPQYEVTSAVYIQDDKSDNSNVLLESLGLSAYKNNIDNEIEVFRSKNQITAVVESLGLYKSYAWKPFMRTTPLYGNSPVELVPDSIDLRAIQSPLTIELEPRSGGKFHLLAYTHNIDGDKVEICDEVIDALPYTVPFNGGTVQMRYTGDTIPVMEKTLLMRLSNPRGMSKTIAENLTVSFASKDATILSVVYRTPVVQEGKDFVAALVDFYNIDAANLKNQGNEKTQEFIDARLSSISEELAIAEAQVEAYRSHNNLIDLSSEAKLYIEQTGYTACVIVDLEQFGKSWLTDVKTN